MEKKHWLLKLIAAVLLLGAAACAVTVYWDKLTDLFYTLYDKIEERRANRAAVLAEFEDYDDGALTDE